MSEIGEQMRNSDWKLVKIQVYVISTYCEESPWMYPIPVFQSKSFSIAAIFIRFRREV